MNFGRGKLVRHFVITRFDLLQFFKKRQFCHGRTPEQQKWKRKIEKAQKCDGSAPRLGREERANGRRQTLESALSITAAGRRVKPTCSFEAKSQSRLWRRPGLLLCAYVSGFN